MLLWPNPTVKWCTAKSTGGLSLEYEKQQVLPRADLQWYAGINHTTGNFADYYPERLYLGRKGVPEKKQTGGEISASRNLLQLNSRNAVSRFNVHYEPWKNGRITLNVFSSWFRRTGQDPVCGEVLRSRLLC